MKPWIELWLPTNDVFSYLVHSRPRLKHPPRQPCRAPDLLFRNARNSLTQPRLVGGEKKGFGP
jgi:hypothetical protein